MLGTEPVGAGRTLVKAEVPELEITRYAIDLRSMSHGTGTFQRAFLRYEPLPPHLAEQGRRHVTSAGRDGRRGQVTQSESVTAGGLKPAASSLRALSLAHEHHETISFFRPKHAGS